MRPALAAEGIRHDDIFRGPWPADVASGDLASLDRGRTRGSRHPTSRQLGLLPTETTAWKHPSRARAGRTMRRELRRVLCCTLPTLMLGGGCKDAPKPVPPPPLQRSEQPRRAAESGPMVEPHPEGVRGSLDDARRAAAVREGLVALRGQTPSVLRVGNVLEAFYEQRRYQPVFGEGAPPRASAETVLTALRVADAHGLPSARYDIRRLSELAETQDISSTQLELRLLDAWLSVGADLLGGVVDARTVHADWNLGKRGASVVAALQGAVDSGDFEGALAALAPSAPGYHRLLEALARYRKLSGSGAWPGKVAELQEGDRGDDVAALGERLAAEGDLRPDTVSTFDAEFVDAIVSVQARNGLPETGRLDSETRAALEISPSERVQTIVANLERWRWLPDDLGATHVRVNIAAFEAEGWSAGAPQLSMRVVVGKLYRETPVFSDVITHVVLNPRWSVPVKLAVEDVLPKIRKDPGFLRKKGFKVFDARSGLEVAPESVAWEELGPRKFNVILRQDPGPENPLGQLKIMFPNPHDVYLHDTPKRNLFRQTTRTFSSGCVRLEDPRRLAEFLLNDPRWDRARIDKAIATGREQTIWLQTPIPVHLLYWTAWVDVDGGVHFRDDVYGRDARLSRALADSAVESFADP